MPDARAIAVIGGGAFGTAFSNALARNPANRVLLFSREPKVVTSVNADRVNTRYFPSNLLDIRLGATGDPAILLDRDWIFLALPASAAVSFVNEHRGAIGADAVIVNMAKGFGLGARTICESLSDLLPNPVASLKGPTFAAETINNLPSAFTFAADDDALFHRMTCLRDGTHVYLDFTHDVKGVEVLSALKNMYAILIGVIDGHFNSANVRYLVMTRAFDEMRRVLLAFGGEQETLFRYCGFGDLGLTALNDLSRNRTLGLLVGKGFLCGEAVSGVILEGRRSLDVFVDALRSQGAAQSQYSLLLQLHKLLSRELDVPAFVRSILDASTQNGALNNDAR